MTNDKKVIRPLPIVVEDAYWLGEDERTEDYEDTMFFVVTDIEKGYTCNLEN